MLNKIGILGYILLILSISNSLFAADNTETYFVGGSTMGIKNVAAQDIEITLNTALKDVISPDFQPIKILIYPNTKALYAAFDKGEINGIFGTILEYLGRENQLAKSKVSIVYNNQSKQQKLVLVARRNAGISQLSDLKNKRLAFAKTQDLETLYLNTLLLRNKLPEIPEFFSSIIDSKSSNFSIMSVFFNNADATIIYENEYLTSIELNPQISKKLFILASSLPYTGMLGGARNDISDKKATEIADLFKKMSHTKKAKQVLAMVNADSIESISDADIQSVRDLLLEYDTLKKN